ncbi:reverse transcriptase-like protein [Arthrobacter sp. ATA002]|uniref:reverse transcriptase-like protein n=1 Tax=Arthrobacter sp. ATA002 TaxID=2991715 RepID=UPI003FA49EA1
MTLFDPSDTSADLSGSAEPADKPGSAGGPAAGSARRTLIVEADGGSRGNPGHAGYGALVRDPDTGAILAEKAEYIGKASNNVAEYSGLLAALEMAHDIDPDCWILAKMDSKLVVEQMSGRWKIKHEDMQRLAAKARGIVNPRRVKYQWIPRELNKDADRLSNEAMDAGIAGVPWVHKGGLALDNGAAFAAAPAAQAVDTPEPHPRRNRTSGRRPLPFPQSHRHPPAGSTTPRSGSGTSRPRKRRWGGSWNGWATCAPMPGTRARSGRAPTATSSLKPGLMCWTPRMSAGAPASTTSRSAQEPGRG